MSDLLQRFESQKPSEFRERSEESLRWFRDQMRGLKVNVNQFYKQSDFDKTRRYLEGRMYTYFYDPKYSEVLQTRLRITWDIIRSAAKLKWARPCLKRYLTSHVVGPALEVTPDHWDTVAMLPLARFEKQSVRQVYTESRKKVI